MAKTKQENESQESGTQQNNLMDVPKRATQENRVTIYINRHVKYNGTWYADTVASVDAAVAKDLIADGSARKATQEEIEEANSNLEDQRMSISDKPETLRALGIDPAVNQSGEEIPNSLNTRETKLRDEDGNTLTGEAVNNSDGEEDETTTEGNADLSKAASANPPDTSGAKKTNARRI